MYLDNKLVFIAGATGSVGSAIVQYIIDNHPETRIRASYRKTEPFIKHENIEYIKGDLLSRDDCRRLVQGSDCAIMAASDSAGSKLMTSEPWRFLNPNIIMNSNMLEAFYNENVKRVVYIGTATVYQSFEGYIKEDELDFNKDPHSAYFGVAWISRFIEKLCRFWNMKTGMETILIRAANIYGPYASFNPDRSYFVPAIIRKASEKMDPFEVWGSPDVTRDVVFSEDFARAIVMLLNKDDIKFDIFNLGSGVKTTVGDVVDYSLKSAGHTPKEIKFGSDKPTTIKFRALDISKVANVLGWMPAYTPEEGIKKTVEWWSKNREVWNK